MYFVHGYIRMIFCSAVPNIYSIVSPSTDNNVINYDENTPSVYVTCILSDIIQHNITVTWLHNGSLARTTSPNEVMEISNTATLIIGNPELSDGGTYQCVFIDNADGWELKRKITLYSIVTSKLCL